MKIEIDVEIPVGYDATGEYRVPARSELYMTNTGRIGASDGCMDTPRIIVRKKVISGQAWINSMPDGAVFMCRRFVYEKQGSEVFAIGCEADIEVQYGWSDATCKIIYTPEQDGENKWQK